MSASKSRMVTITILLTTLASCMSKPKPVTVPLQFSNQAGIYVPIAPIALKAKLPFEALLMTRSFDAYTDEKGKIIASVPSLINASAENTYLTRTTDVISYTTVKVSETQTEQLFAVIGYGARGSFSVRITQGRIEYLTNSVEGSSRSENSDVFQMGEGGVLASILLPDEAITSENFKKATRTMLSALRTDPTKLITPVLLGGLVYSTDSTIDPDKVSVEVLNSPVVKKLLFQISNEADLKAAIESSEKPGA